MAAGANPNFQETWYENWRVVTPANDLDRVSVGWPGGMGSDVASEVGESFIEAILLVTPNAPHHRAAACDMDFRRHTRRPLRCM